MPFSKSRIFSEESKDKVDACSIVDFDQYPDNCIKKIDSGWIFKLTINDLGELLKINDFNEVTIKQCIFLPNSDSKVKERHVKLMYYYKHKIGYFSNTPYNIDVEVPFDLKDLIDEIKDKVDHDREEKVVSRFPLLGYPEDTLSYGELLCSTNTLFADFGSFHKNYDGPNDKLKINLSLKSFPVYGSESLRYIKAGGLYLTFVFKEEATGDILKDLMFFKYDITKNSNCSLSLQRFSYPNLHLYNVQDMYPASWGS